VNLNILFLRAGKKFRMRLSGEKRLRNREWDEKQESSGVGVDFFEVFVVVFFV